MGGSAAVGKGGGGKQGEDLLNRLINDVNADISPLRTEVSNQMLEALRTGGIGATLPIATALQDQSRSGTARALQATRESIDSMGLGRTPYAASTLAQTRLSGERATSMIPAQIAQGFINAAPQFAMAPVGALTGGAGQLGGIQANRDIAKGNQTTQLYSSILQGAASGAAAACWIARRFYGDSPDFYAARYVILRQWRGPLANLIRRMYLRHGEWVSRQPWVGVLRPLFDLAVRRYALR